MLTQKIEGKKNAHPQVIGYLVGSVYAARQAVLAGRCRFGGDVGGVLDAHLVLLNVLHRKLDPRGVTTNHFSFSGTDDGCCCYQGGSYRIQGVMTGSLHFTHGSMAARKTGQIAKAIKAYNQGTSLLL